MWIPPGFGGLWLAFKDASTWGREEWNIYKEYNSLSLHFENAFYSLCYIQLNKAHGVWYGRSLFNAFITWPWCDPRGDGDDFTKQELVDRNLFDIYNLSHTYVEDGNYNITITFDDYIHGIIQEVVNITVRQAPFLSVWLPLFYVFDCWKVGSVLALDIVTHSSPHTFYNSKWLHLTLTCRWLMCPQALLQQALAWLCMLQMLTSLFD